MTLRNAVPITFAVMVLFAITVPRQGTAQPEQSVSPEVVLDLGIERPDISDLRQYSLEIGAATEATAGGTLSAPRAGQPNIMKANAALSAAVLTTYGGKGSQFAEVTLLGDWDGREDLCADRQLKITDFSSSPTAAGATLTRVAVSEHTIANGFAENIYYYGDSVGNVYIGADSDGNGTVDNVVTINLPTALNAFGNLNSDDQVVITGLGVNPVADLSSFVRVNGAYTAFTGVVGEILYVSFWDTGSGLRLTSNNMLVRSGVLAYPIADAISPPPNPPGVVSSDGFPVTVGSAFGVAFSVFGNLAGLAVDDDGSVYFQQVDLVQFTGGNIVKIASVDKPGAGGNQDRSLATSGFLFMTTLSPAGGVYGTASGPSDQVNRFTNYSGMSPLFGNIVALASGSCNTLYAAVARSLSPGGDPGTQATEGLFPSPPPLGDTPAMIISFADCAGSFDECSQPQPGDPGGIPIADGFADPVPGSPGLNWIAFVLGQGPDRRMPGSPVFPPELLKVDMLIDYTVFSGLTVDEDSKLYVISGGTPGGVGRDPSPNLTEVLCFPDQCPIDRRADYVDLRDNRLPNPPLSGGNIGDGDSDRFDHIFTVAPIDQVTVMPTGMAGLARGFLMYLNRTRPGGFDTLPNGEVQGDDSTNGPVVFDDFDPSFQVSGGDDQYPPFFGDDKALSGDPILTQPLAGGFEFTFSTDTNTTGCVWNGFWLNSNGSITFGNGDTDNTPTETEFRTGLPRLAGAWCDLNPSSRDGGAIRNTFPVQALGFAAVNHFKVRFINVPEFGKESCGGSNTFSMSMYDDGIGVDENAAGNAEGPTDARWVKEPVTGVVVPTHPRQDGTGQFCFNYCRMDLLGTQVQPVLVGYSVGEQPASNPPGLCEVNLSELARQADHGLFGVLGGGQVASLRHCLIGEGTEPTIHEFFNSGTEAGLGPGGVIVPAVPDFDLRNEGAGAPTCTPVGQPDPNRGNVCFFGVSCGPPPDPVCSVVFPDLHTVTPGSSGLINVLCGTTINIVGSGFFPNEATVICQGEPEQRPGKTVSSAVVMKMDCDNDGTPETILPLANVTPVNANLVRAVLVPLAGSGLPGTPFPLGCCGGITTVALTTSFSAGENNVFGPFTRTTECPLDVGHRAPVVISASPSNGDCSVLQNITIPGSCFKTPYGDVTEAFAVEEGNPGNVIYASNVQVISASLVDALFDFGGPNCGKTFRIFLESPGGISRNLWSLPPGSPAGCPLGNEQGVPVTFTCSDLVAPVITCPDTIVARPNKRVGKVRGAYVTFPTPTATDNCAAGVTVTCTPPSGSFFPQGETTVTCTATDAAGNHSSCTFEVFVGRVRRH